MHPLKVGKNIRVAIIGLTAVGVFILGSGGYGIGQTFIDDLCNKIIEGSGSLGCGRNADVCPVDARYALTGVGQGIGLAGPENIKFDAVASSTGGSGVVRPLDTIGASATCTFSTSPSTNFSGIQIVTNSRDEETPLTNCTDPSNCIRCTISELGSSCRIECLGLLQANTETNADSFDITIVFTHLFDTDNPGPPAAIRMDALASLWPEFLTEGASPDFITTEGCDGSNPEEMILNQDDPLNLNEPIPGVSFSESFGIDAASPGGNCRLLTAFTARMPLAGILEEGPPVEVERGPIFLYGRICEESDIEQNCPAPDI